MEDLRLTFRLNTSLFKTRTAAPTAYASVSNKLGLRRKQAFTPRLIPP